MAAEFELPDPLNQDWMDELQYHSSQSSVNRGAGGTESVVQSVSRRMEQDRASNHSSNWSFVSPKQAAAGQHHHQADEVESNAHSLPSSQRSSYGRGPLEQLSGQGRSMLASDVTSSQERAYLSYNLKEASKRRTLSERFRIKPDHIGGGDETEELKDSFYRAQMAAYDADTSVSSRTDLDISDEDADLLNSTHILTESALREHDRLASVDRDMADSAHTLNGLPRPLPDSLPKKSSKASYSYIQHIVKALLLAFVFFWLVRPTSDRTALPNPPADIELIFEPAPAPTQPVVVERVAEEPPTVITRPLQPPSTSYFPVIAVVAFMLAIYKIFSYVSTPSKTTAKGMKRKVTRPASEVSKSQKSLQGTESNQSSQYRQTDFNVYLMGAPKAGLTTLYHRQLYGHLRDMHLGLTESPCKQTFTKAGHVICLNVHDTPVTARNGKFKWTVSMRGPENVAVLVFDIMSEHSLAVVKNVAASILQRPIEQQCHIFAVANKSDTLEVNSTVREQAIAWADTHGFFYTEVSGLTGHNVVDCFRDIVRTLRDQL